MKARAAAIGIVAVLASALFAQPASAEDVPAVLVFDGTLGQETTPNIQPVFLSLFDFSGLATIEIGGKVVVSQEQVAGAVGSLRTVAGARTDENPNPPPKTYTATFQTPQVPLPTVADLTFTCGAQGTGGTFEGGCLLEGYGPTSEGTWEGNIGDKEGEPEAGEPLVFTVVFSLKCGEKDNPCPPSDTEPA